VLWLVAAEGKLTELLDTITARLKDAMADMSAATHCIEAYKRDPTGAQACIIEYLQTGKVPEETPK
jgi:hypothetical protein